MNIPDGFKMVPAEPTDEIIRSMLAVRWPATYRNTLRFSGSGPATAAQAERDIAEAKEQFGAMLAAAPAPPKPIYDEANRIAELEQALAGMLFAFDDGVGRDWSEDLLDFASKMTPAVEFQSRAKAVEVGHE